LFATAKYSAMFGNAFKPRAHYVFNYKPRYYDERKERLAKLKEKYKNSEEISDEIPRLKLSKDKLRSEWRRHKKTSDNRASNLRLAIIIAILVGILAYFFELHKLF
jgi:hypothetical protein